jgi:hypothetical protein
MVPYAARYNGRSWRKVRMPGGALAVSALSRADMWAIGPTSTTATRAPARQSLIAMHWDGRSWRTVPVPRVRLSGAGSYFLSDGIAATGARGLWWYYTVYGEGARAPRRNGLLRWNGSRWITITVPAGTNDISAVAQDGTGGAWLLADDLVNYSLVQYWYHYSKGQWTRQVVPSPRKYGDTMFGVARIPGTTSVWSVGEADLNYGNGSIGVIAG